MDKAQLETAVRTALQELLGASPSTPEVRSVSLPRVQLSESDRLNTGDPAHRVYTHDLFTLSESPRLGVGMMEMTDTTFPWHLDYDEVDYVVSGRLSILWKGRAISASAGELIFIPKGSDISFSVSGHARFLYVTYPADWQNQT